jgi:hypothetical protein
LAQKILGFFENSEELRQAREEAKKLRDRIRGFSNEAQKTYTPFSEDNKYGGISSDDYANTPNSKEGTDKQAKGAYKDNLRDEEYFGSKGKEKTLDEKLNLASKEKQTDAKNNEAKGCKAKVAEEDLMDIGVESTGKETGSANVNLLDGSEKKVADNKCGGKIKLLPPPPKRKVISDSVNVQTEKNSNGPLVEV